jgi:hypothetical protein
MPYAFGTLKQRLQGAQIKFIPDGTVIGENTIAVDEAPVLADFTDDYLIGTVALAKYVPTVEERPRKKYVVGSGWKQTKDKLILEDAFEVTMDDFATGLHDQLAFGLANTPAANTAQQIFADQDRLKEGWILINLYEVEGGGDDISGQAIFHAKLELQTVPEIKDEKGSPVWKITHLADGGALDTFKPYPA